MERKTCDLHAAELTLARAAATILDLALANLCFFALRLGDDESAATQVLGFPQHFFRLYRFF